MTPFDLTGKNIVVTGASSGIGRQVAISCSRMGARIILSGRNINRLNETLSMMPDQQAHLIIAHDLTDIPQTEIVVQEIISKTGKIYGIVHCAGIGSTLPLRSVTPEKLLQQFNTNVFAAYHLTRIASSPKYFSPEGGSIVFMASVAGMVGENAKSAYSMSKGALIAGARSLAVELSAKNIRVNAVSPGLIITPINMHAEHITNPEKRKEIEDKHLLGLGTAEDIGNACIYLLSDASRWVTGTNLVVDGGYTAR